MEFEIPSGQLTVCYEKSPSLIGKSTINVPFSMAMLNCQRVNLMGLPISRQPSWVTAASRFFYTGEVLRGLLVVAVRLDQERWIRLDQERWIPSGKHT